MQWLWYVIVIYFNHCCMMLKARGAFNICIFFFKRLTPGERSEKNKESMAIR